MMTDIDVIKWEIYEIQHLFVWSFFAISLHFLALIYIWRTWLLFFHSWLFLHFRLFLFLRHTFFLFWLSTNCSFLLLQILQRSLQQSLFTYDCLNLSIFLFLNFLYFRILISPELFQNLLVPFIFWIQFISLICKFFSIMFFMTAINFDIPIYYSYFLF
jgi:hypothetical protein